MQAQRPQQMQQIKETMREATIEAMINQNHQTGRHSSEKKKVIRMEQIKIKMKETESEKIREREKKREI